MKRNTYSTKQKERLLEVIRNYNSDFAINDIYNVLNKEIGLTTIYRYLDELIKEERVKKFTKNKKVIYHYIEECHHDNHFYLKCNKCGEMIHIDCDCINEFIDIVKNNHNFYINTKNIIIDGTCNKCYKEN